ncbi:hypothetical protein OCJ37_19770 [Xanthomonas sp. AM6]|nr:hypothetical protein [Xanthomonas sp. AM6]UYB52172.1 hypothetical protein OCJ37_19770 [Xanthomonas sp. AM6]
MQPPAIDAPDLGSAGRWAHQIISGGDLVRALDSPLQGGQLSFV